MTKRNKELKMQRDYEQALHDVEKMRPKGFWRKIYSENGSEAGRAIYDAKDDTLTIETDGTTVRIKGEHILSIYQYLQDLFSEADNEKTAEAR